MGAIRAIRSEADHMAALVRIGELMGAESGTPEADELDILTDLVELFEAKRMALGHRTPPGAIHFRMEQSGLPARDLTTFIGSRAKVSEMLSGKRPLTTQIARALRADRGIPADVLLQRPGRQPPAGLTKIEWHRFPLAEMARRGWIERSRNPTAHAQEVIRDLIRRAGGEQVLRAAFYCTDDHARLNAKTDRYSLKAWCLEVLARANSKTLPAP